MKVPFESLLDGALLYCDSHKKILEVNDQGKQIFNEVDWDSPVYVTDLLRSPEIDLNTFCADKTQLKVLLFDQFSQSKGYKTLKTKSADDGSFHLFLRETARIIGAQSIEISRTLSLVANYSNSCVLLVSKTGDIQYANQRFLDLFDVSLNQALTSNVKNYVRKRAHFRVIAQGLVSNEFSPIILDQTLQFLTKTGRKIWMSLQLHPVLNSEHTVVVLENVSAHVKIQDDLIKARNLLKEAEIERSRLLANISHELRTPLTAIRGTLSNIELTQSASLSVRDLNLMLHASDSLNMVIEEMLVFAQDSLATFTLNIDKVNLRTFVEQIYEMSKMQHQDFDGIVFTFEISPTLPSCLLLDVFRVQQIVFNLISNAFKFTEQGAIHVEFGGQLNPQDNTQVLLVISVQDSGIGVPNDKLKTIFVPFKQLDNQTTRSARGLGLGLSIVQKLTDLMAGEVSVESVVGNGSCFRVSIPLEVTSDAETASASVQHHLSANPPSEMRILLVEDNDINAKIVSKNLSSLGNRVSLAKNGQQALDALQSYQFDIVLMDVQMPIMDGFVATSRIRQSDRITLTQGKHIPIIGLTADATYEATNKCLSLGMDDVVNKPIKFERLYDVMGQHVKTTHGIKAAAPKNEHTPAQANISDSCVWYSQVSKDFFAAFQLNDSEIQCIQEIIDVEVAMDYAENDYVFYKQCLQLLSVSIAKFDLLTDRQEISFSDIGFEAHQIGSAAGMVGAITLSQEAKLISTEIDRIGRCEIELLAGLSSKLGDLRKAINILVNESK